MTRAAVGIAAATAGTVTEIHKIAVMAIAFLLVVHLVATTSRLEPRDVKAIYEMCM